MEENKEVRPKGLFANTLGRALFGANTQDYAEGTPEQQRDMVSKAIGTTASFANRLFDRRAGTGYDPLKGAEVNLDLSSIARNSAVDRAREALKKRQALDNKTMLERALSSAETLEQLTKSIGE